MLLKATGSREGGEEEGEPSLQWKERVSVSVSVQGANPKLHKPDASGLRSVCFFQLSNEMQLSIMKKVKSGELSIEDALDQARKDGMQLLQQQSQAEEVTVCLK